ncbi:unnamed protein product [Anisakis simplex]|uniref:Valacyclovir hydrolase (inferred by orthology to a human protein) n=1 Tax=Anisakis simplex TaxID=6269 RepID=A0A0M3K770_ANISI|nr:unnamed protein product [Anisakis simplex]
MEKRPERLSSQVGFDRANGILGWRRYGFVASGHWYTLGNVKVSCNNSKSEEMKSIKTDESLLIRNATSNKSKYDEDNENNSKEITENTTVINDTKIGYSIYGNGLNKMLFICGGVGCYKKDYPLSLQKSFNPSNYTIVCIDPPGYGTSRPPDRKQEVNRCMKDASFCIKLMQYLKMIPFTVLGWSEGSRTAIHVADQGRFGSLIKSVILLSAASRIDYRGVQVFKGMRNTEQWLSHTMDSYLEFYSKEFVSKQWADLCDIFEEVYNLLGGRFPCDYVLANIKIPVLILNGGMDRFCADPNYFKSVLNNCKIESHLLGGHDFYMKYPRWFSERLEEFLKENKIFLLSANADGNTAINNNNDKRGEA